MRLPAIAMGSRELKKTKPLLAGTDVRNLQQLLKGLGFFNSRIDGVFGYETELAVRMFQEAFGMKASGIVDKKLFDILQIIEKGGGLHWLTFQKDYCHTGYSPVPVPFSLKAAGKKRLSGIMDFCTYGGILIAVTRDGVCAMDIKSLETRWYSRGFSPIAGASLSVAGIVVPAGSLVILDMYTGKILATVNDDIFMTPAAIVKGMILASAKGSVHALDEKGDKLWRYKTEGALCSPPSVAYDLIYFASSDKNVYCLDKNGDLYWKTRVDDFISDPLPVWAGKVFALSRSSWFYALNPLSGDIIWKKKFSDEEFLAPAFNQDFLLAVDVKGGIFALSPQRGEIMWLKRLEAEPATLPIICSDTVFLGTEKGIAAINAKTGQIRILLEGKKIKALIQARSGIVAASENELVALSPAL
ncbi:MAG TPA: PQQ-binding-like beta-propeller repeat protein [Thermoanaerobacterales bacterium]|nr:PQQ-binding-like beta-propeller repeat protein [Thermoanaerobacterales bacterium]